MSTDPRRSNLLALLLAAMACAAAAETASSPKERAKEQLAVRAAAGRVLEELHAAAATQSVDVVVLADELGRRMLGDVAAHRKAAAARDQARPFLREQRLAALGLALTNAVAAAQERSALPIQAGEVMHALGAEWGQLADAAAAAFLSNQFDRVFTDARLRAVSVQAREAEGRLGYPAAGALDGQWSPLVREGGQPADDAVDRLAKWLAATAPKDLPVLFEEVEQQLGDVGRRMAEEIARQSAAQLEAVQQAARAAPRDARMATAIATFLHGAATNNIEEARRQAAAAGRTAPVYPLFASTAREAERAAKQLEQERLSAQVAGWTDFGVAVDRLAQEIEREPARHRKPAESAEHLTDSTLEDVRSRLARQYGGEAQAGHFTEQLRGDGAAAKQLREAARRSVDAALPAARAQVAERQLAPLAPSLQANRTFPDAAIAKWHEQGCRAVEKTEDALARLRDAGEPADATALIEEAATQLVARVAGRARAACDALNGQLQQLRALETEKVAELQRDVAAERPVDEIVRAWRKALETRWTTAAGPDTPYRQLLARTTDQLNKTVRQLYDAKRQEAAQAKTVQATESQQTEPVPPQTTAIERGSSPPEAERDEDRDKKGGMTDEVLLGSADLVLNLAGQSAREGRAVLSAADAELASFAYDPSAAQAAADAIFAGMKTPLERVLAERQAVWSRRSGGFFSFRRAELPELKVYVIVESNELRHRTSLLLRRQVKAFVEEWSGAQRPGKSAIELRWTVSLGQPGAE